LFRSPGKIKSLIENKKAFSAHDDRKSSLFYISPTCHSQDIPSVQIRQFFWLCFIVYLAFPVSQWHF